MDAGKNGSVKRILLTGATGYIGRRLLPLLLQSGHEVLCVVRDKKRFTIDTNWKSSVHLIEADLLQSDLPEVLPPGIDAAYYLVHSMTSSDEKFDELEYKAASNFSNYLHESQVEQVIYLSGLAHDNALSKHLASRKKVEEILEQSTKPLTVLRAGIIIGSGSASFEIIRDLVEKLPVMITPKWLNSKNQPIAIENVLGYLTGVLFNRKTYNDKFDIGGPEQLTYKDMILKFAEVRGYKRWVITLPLLTPKLSARWLIFVTSTPYNLAKNLVDSLKNDAVCKENSIREIINLSLISYTEAVNRAFSKIEQNSVISRWTDAVQSVRTSREMSRFVKVPIYGCFKDSRAIKFKGNREKVLDKIWSIGGKNGWYFADSLWQIRGLIDKLIGGVGLRRGRRDPKIIRIGDTLDFWRVLLADWDAGRLLLYAEMKLPGEAWLEFEVTSDNSHHQFKQTATFRPRGWIGRLYWLGLLPLHHIIFSGMSRRIVSASTLD